MGKKNDKEKLWTIVNVVITLRRKHGLYKHIIILGISVVGRCFTFFLCLPVELALEEFPACRCSVLGIGIWPSSPTVLESTDK